WFFLTLAPTSSIMPISTEVGAERRMYLPLMAVVALVIAPVGQALIAWPISTAVNARHEGVQHRGRFATLVIVAPVALLLAVATYQRNAEYRSGLTLWQTVLDRWPPHARAHRNLAAELKLANRPDEEIAHLREAVKDLPEIRNLLGLELLALGRSAVAADPGNGLSQRNLALQYLQQSDFPKAVAHAREAVRLTPSDFAAHNLLGLSLIGEQKVDEAIAEFRASLALQPQNNDASGFLERTLKAAGREP